jgi:aminoglycoside phosphotransferase (APT) family kinase protein
MEFVKGRIIADTNLSELSPSDRRKAWFSAIETLAWLHSLDPDAIGLDGYGKKTGFYARHCNTWSRIEAQQAAVKEAKTGKALGRAHKRYDEIMDCVRNNLPGDRFSIVHGDFKFDNLVCGVVSQRQRSFANGYVQLRYFTLPSLESLQS